MKGKEIDALDIVIQAGLYLKGTINFLGLKLSAEIAVNLPDNLFVDIEMSPIDWAGGLIAVRRSQDDTKNGPKAFIYITTSSLTVQIKGYMSLFGINSMVDIDISDTAFTVKLEGNFWGVLEGKLHLEAAWGNLAALHFEVSTFFLCIDD